jgi:integrase
MMWTDDEVRRFLVAAANHRLAAAFRIAVLYGLRRSEVLALRWDDIDTEAKTLRIDEGLVAVRFGIEWSDGKNTRSRRTIPLDPESMTALEARRQEQNDERLEAGDEWTGEDLIFTSREWGPLAPRSFDRSLERLLKRAGLPILTSHRLRHTAATHMVANASRIASASAPASESRSVRAPNRPSEAHCPPAWTANAPVCRLWTMPEGGCRTPPPPMATRRLRRDGRVLTW